MGCKRCVDIVVGGQAGSEAKGKLISLMPSLPGCDYVAICRSGSTNASHAVMYKGKKIFFHQLPAGCLHMPKAKIVLTANAQIDYEYLNREIQLLKDNDCWLGEDGKPRLMIDPNATIIDPIDKIAENGGRMPGCGTLYFHPLDCDVHNQEIRNKDTNKDAGTCIGCPQLPPDSAWAKLGSTTHGGGCNSGRKMARGTKMLIPNGSQFDIGAYFQEKCGINDQDNYDEAMKKVSEVINSGPVTDWGKYVGVEPIRFASDDEVTKPFIADTVDYLNRAIDRNEPVLLEGTQGSVLSLHFGPQGKTTSRDTNASNWCMEAGISPLAIRDVYMVIRTFPIRVAGDSGPMPGTELTWDEVTKFAESPEPIIEHTSATHRVRRVSTIGEASLRRALDLNRPTKILLTFADYLHYTDAGKTSWDDLSQKAKDWITTFESKMGVFFDYLSTGPGVEHTIVRNPQSNR